MDFNKSACWLAVAVAGGIFVSFVGQWTKTEIVEQDSVGGIVFRLIYLLYGYCVLTMLDWALS